MDSINSANEFVGSNLFSVLMIVAVIGIGIALRVTFRVDDTEYKHKPEKVNDKRYQLHFLSGKKYLTMKKYSGYIILIPLAIGLLTIAGWVFSIDILKRPAYSHVAMNPVTAICFILCSIAFFLDFKREFNNKISVISALISVSVATVGIARLLEVAGLDLHIDNWLFHDAMIVANGHGYVNHMTANSALGFILMGLALRFGIVSGERIKIICCTMALGAFVIGLSAFMAYVYHVRQYYHVLNYLPMALMTAVCFMCLSVAFLIENWDQAYVDKTLSAFQKWSKLKADKKHEAAA